MLWNPDRYHKFTRERSAPFNDLLRLVRRREKMRVVDLGCGTGELTRRLADALPGSEVIGVDTSYEMLARAVAHKRNGINFELAAIESITGRWDLLFAHASLQWVDNHGELIPRLFAMVRPGGQLVVQLPSNHHHLAHHQHPRVPWIHLPRFVDFRAERPSFLRTYLSLWKGPRPATEPSPGPIGEDLERQLSAT